MPLFNQGWITVNPSFPFSITQRSGFYQDWESINLYFNFNLSLPHYCFLSSASC